MLFWKSELDVWEGLPLEIDSELKPKLQKRTRHIGEFFKSSTTLEFLDSIGPVKLNAETFQDECVSKNISNAVKSKPCLRERASTWKSTNLGERRAANKETKQATASVYEERHRRERIAALHWPRKRTGQDVRITRANLLVVHGRHMAQPRTEKPGCWSCQAFSDHKYQKLVVKLCEWQAVGKHTGGLAAGLRV